MLSFDGQATGGLQSWKFVGNFREYVTQPYPSINCELISLWYRKVIIGLLKAYQNQ